MNPQIGLPDLHVQLPWAKEDAWVEVRTITDSVTHVQSHEVVKVEGTYGSFTLEGYLDAKHDGALDTFLSAVQLTGISDDGRYIYYIVKRRNVPIWLLSFVGVFKFRLKLIYQRILFTLHIWGLANHTPGMYMSFSDIKIVSSIRKRLKK